MNYIVTSKYVNKFICFSKNEIDYYSSIFKVDKNKFAFVHLGGHLMTMLVSAMTVMFLQPDEVTGIMIFWLTCLIRVITD